jgi:hypothetical protein
MSREQQDRKQQADTFDWYLENREKIVAGHLGEFVGLKNSRVLGYFKTAGEARDFMKRTGEEYGTYLIHECCEEEPIFDMRSPYLVLDGRKRETGVFKPCHMMPSL